MSVKEIGYFSRSSSNSFVFFSNEYFIDASLIIIRLSTLKQDLECFFPFLPKGIPITREDTIDFWIEKKLNEVTEFYQNKGKVVIIADISPKLFYHSELLEENRVINLLDIFLAKQYALSYETYKGNSIINDPLLNELVQDAENSFEFVYSKLSSNVKVLSTTIKTKKPISFMTDLYAGRLLVLHKIEFDGFQIADPSFFDWFTREVTTIFNSADKDLTAIVSNQPSWLKDYHFDKEPELNLERGKIEQAISAKEKELKAVDAKLYEYQILKATLFADGNNLEVAVGKCLTKLGVNHFYPEGSETDLIIDDGNSFIAVEIKGTIGSINMRHTRQLEDWVNRTANKYNRDEVKGLLIINSHNNLPLEERAKILTPPNILEHSVSRKHCILHTPTLLALVQDFENGTIDKEKILDLISNCNGLLQYPLNLYTGTVYSQAMQK